MIAKHQPTIFGKQLIVAVSAIGDGNMKFGVSPGEDVAANRTKFLGDVDISLDQTTIMSLTYDRDDYAMYRQVTDEDQSKGMHRRENVPTADAIITTQPGHALFLPVADCCAVVLYDPVAPALMLSHIGRHSAEVDGATKSVAYLQQKFGSQPADMKVWLGPAVGKLTYPITKKDGKGLHETILEQLAQAGVPSENIETCPVDTATDPNYFSHSQFKAGNQPVDGRFGVVAMIAVQDEPAF